MKSICAGPDWLFRAALDISHDIIDFNEITKNKKNKIKETHMTHGSKSGPG